MEAIVISSESDISGCNSDDSDFEREIEEVKRRSILECRRVGERSDDDVGEGSSTIKVTAVFSAMCVVEDSFYIIFERK